MGVTDKEWNQIIAAAEEVQDTGDHRNLEQYEHEDTGLRLFEEETTIQPHGTYTSAVQVSFNLQQHHHQEHQYSHLVKEHTSETPDESTNEKRGVPKTTYDHVECGICEVSFINENNLKHHRELKHTYHYYGCKTKFYFEQRWNLHNAEKHKFSCEKCNLHFIEEPNWKNQIADGHRMEPWKLVDQEIPCLKCNLKFISKNDLKYHNDCPHTHCCYECKTRFYSEQKWKRHINTEHKYTYMLQCV